MSPQARGQVAIRVGGAWYTATFPPDDALDVDVLERELLGPILGITDVRTDKRIDFVGGIRGPAELERLVDAGGFAVAFSMYPVSTTDLMRIADAGGICIGEPVDQDLVIELPPCPTEDSEQCIWSADEQGNGSGTDFIRLNGTTYLPEGE